VIRILDFGATWCAPCKTLRPTIERIAREYDISIEEIDVDQDSNTAEKYGIVSLPTVLFLTNGQAVTTLYGSKVNYASITRVLGELGLHRTRT